MKLYRVTTLECGQGCLGEKLWALEISGLLVCTTERSEGGGGPPPGQCDTKGAEKEGVHPPPGKPAGSPSPTPTGNARGVRDGRSKGTKKKLVLVLP